jgi:hypothetical protein
MRLRVYTVHERAAAPGADPDVVLVREGFSWAAAIFGVLWLLAHRLWLASAILIAVTLLLFGLAELLDVSEAAEAVIALGLAVLTGYLGPEAWRWRLARTGYGLLGVVAARNRDAAEHRLFSAWPADHRAAFTPAARLAPL